MPPKKRVVRRRKNPDDPPRKIDHVEDGVQKAIVEFHGQVVVNILEAFIFAVANGEKRDPITARRLVGNRPRDELPDGTKIPLSDAQRMTAAGLGVLPGVSDLCLVTLGAVTFIETKKPKIGKGRAGKQTENQLAFQRTVTALNHDYRVVHSVEEYQAVLIEKGVRLKIRSIFPVAPRAVPELQTRFSRVPPLRRGF